MTNILKDLNGYSLRQLHWLIKRGDLPAPTARGKKGEYLYSPDQYERLVAALERYKEQSDWHQKRSLVAGAEVV